MNAELLLLAVLGAAGWFWWDSLCKRELALAAARQACERAGVQLLDETVAVRRLRLRRDARQQARIYREYSFEYSKAGDDRQVGRVYLLGERLISAQLIEAA